MRTGKNSRLSPADAVRLLRTGGKKAPAAAGALTTAIHTGACRLWCDGKQVPSHFAITLAVEVNVQTGAVGITSLAREPWEKPRDAYEWRLDARAVRILAGARRRPGPQPRQDWRILVKKKVKSLKRQRLPFTAAQMQQLCQDELDYEPALRTLQDFLKDF